MSRFENGQFAGASWALVDGQTRRVHFIVDSEHPDGYLLESFTAFESKLEKTIYPPREVPVKVVFVQKPECAEPPSSESIRLSWEDFKPTEDYLLPLS